MAISANSLVGFTTAGRAMLDADRGDGLRSLVRVAKAIGVDRPEQLHVVMKGAGIDALEVASLVRSGLLMVIEPRAVPLCERCNRTPGNGTALCAACRRYLGWARLLGEEVPEAPAILRAPAFARTSTAMHSRGDRSG